MLASERQSSPGEEETVFYVQSVLLGGLVGVDQIPPPEVLVQVLEHAVVHMVRREAQQPAAGLLEDDQQLVGEGVGALVEPGGPADLQASVQDLLADGDGVADGDVEDLVAEEHLVDAVHFLELLHLVDAEGEHLGKQGVAEDRCHSCVLVPIWRHDRYPVAWGRCVEDTT